MFCLLLFGRLDASIIFYCFLWVGLGCPAPIFQYIGENAGNPNFSYKNKYQTKKVVKSRKKWHKVVDKTDTPMYNRTDKTDKGGFNNGEK